MAQQPAEKISAEAVNRFLSLMSQPGRLGDLLRRLHQLRVLEQIIPAMQHARYLMQFNDYHKYTVDEHSIRAVEAPPRSSRIRARLGRPIATCATSGCCTWPC